MQETMITAAWLIFLIPLFIALVIPLFLNNRHREAAWLATSGMFVCFLLTVFLFFQYRAFYAINYHGVETSLVWMQAGIIPIELGLYVNGLTVLMLLIVTGIGALIFLFSVSYMIKDPGCSRYFACLSLFSFSMLGIVLANNLIQIFIFWELVGLSSYLLIGFWFEKSSASTAGKKSFITTRVGDVGMLLGILALFGYFAAQGHGTFNFALIDQNLPLVEIPPVWMTAICMGLFLGVVGKSAQVPLHVWLPDAMEGPTPVSALIHAATMVAAGIFLLARIFFIFKVSPESLTIIAWTGGITMLLAATIALVQNDIKRILAYSTLSQLGYMVFALGLGSSAIGMFHLTTHAFFKALLFLGAGSLIHAFHTQDIWEMGEIVHTQKEKTNKSRFFLFKKMPLTAGTFLIGTLALMGIPPLSGFFSKEEIINLASHGPTPLFVIAMGTVFLTAFYMSRLTMIVFFPSSLNSVKEDSPSIHECDWKMGVPLLVLAILSVVGGFFPIREMVLEGQLQNSAHSETTGLAILSLALAGAGIVAAFFLYSKRSRSVFVKTPLLRVPALVLERKYFFDDFYDALIKFGQKKIARVSDMFERYLFVEWSINGLARSARIAGQILRKLQTGVIQFYAFVFTIAITVILFVLLVNNGGAK